MCLGFFKSTDIAIWRHVAWIKEKAENRESNSDADAKMAEARMRNNGKKRVISEEDTSGEQKEKHIAKYQPKKTLE